MLNGRNFAYFVAGSFITASIFIYGQLPDEWTNTLCEAGAAKEGVLTKGACLRDWASALSGWAAAAIALIVVVPQFRFMRAQIQIPTIQEEIITLNSDISTLDEIMRYLEKQTPSDEECEYERLPKKEMAAKILFANYDCLSQFEEFIATKSIDYLTPDRRKRVEKKVINCLMTAHEKHGDFANKSDHSEQSAEFASRYNEAMQVFIIARKEVSSFADDLKAERDEMSLKIKRYKEATT